MEDDIGTVAFPTSDDREEMIPLPDDSAEAAAARGAGASIAERRAAKFGFNAVKISTARFRTASPTASPAARSPCLTIPPGISPTALLDSPIMLHNSLAMPSPTTGTFSLPYYRHENSVAILSNSDDEEKGIGIESHKFRSYLDQKSLLGGSTFGNQEIEASNHQSVVLEEQPFGGFEFPTEFPGEAAKVSDNNIVITDAKPVNMKLSLDVDENGSHDISDGNHGGYSSYGAVARTSEDGYNWRKYGQKQVKGSEYPRSYYKCTHPNCQVKKKVERSHDGQITEIIYKGAHNHVKPQPNRRAGLGPTLSFDEMSEVSEGSGTCLRVEGGSAWTNVHSGSDVKIGGSDGIEITSSASILTELSDPFSTTAHGRSISTMESIETPELSSTIASHEDDEDGATQGSMSLGGDADDEESESKRRKKESCFVETTLTSRAVREPRVVVQIESEVDILDDGYRWRKYGQKVVKGNPNPRSYYKCTSAGCSVRKHVERASHNLKCVITTYEGKHNHEVPAARNGGNHTNSGSATATAQPSSASNAQPPPPLALQRNPAIPKPETQMQDFPPQFDRKPEFGNEYMRPGAGFPGNFSNDVRFVPPPSIYQMKFPPLQPYTPFGLNPNRFAPQQAGLPDFPMSMPPNLPPPGNLPGMVGFDFNGGKPAGPVLPLPPSGQQLLQNDSMFLRPKQEQRDDVVYDPRLPVADPAANAAALSSFSSSSPAAYNRVMGRFQS